jgi:uncharacterized membrane protein
VAYDILVALHVIVAVVGFGAVAISGAYSGPARHLDRPGAVEEARRYFGARGWVEAALVAVPVFGFAALGAKGDGLAHAWVWAAAAVWLVALAAWLRLVRPAERELRAVVAQTPVDASVAARAGRRLAWGAGVCDVAFVVALGLMVFQP